MPTLHAFKREELLAAARGRIPDLIRRYGGRVMPPGYPDRGRASCPVHQGDSYSAMYSEAILTCFSGCGGRTFDAPALVAACEGLTEFPRVLERLAAALGEAPPPARTYASRPSYPPRDVCALWDRLALADTRSEQYLTSRGLDLREPDLLRFSVGSTGDRWIDNLSAEGYRVAVCLRDPEGIVRDIALRFLGTPADPSKRVLLLPGIKSAGLAMTRPMLPDLPADAPLLVCEGLTDTLAAQELYPQTVVLGAPGAGLAARLLAAFAGFVKGRRVVVALDRDEAGRLAADRAINAAWTAGAASVGRGWPEGKDLAEDLAARKAERR